MYTLADVVPIAEGIVTEAGEGFVYEDAYPDHKEKAEEQSVMSSCFYVAPENGEPACLVGRILHQLGLLHIVVEGHSVSAFNQDHFDKMTVEFFNDLQEIQDGNGTWGHALRYALSRALRKML